MLKLHGGVIFSQVFFQTDEFAYTDWNYTNRIPGSYFAPAEPARYIVNTNNARESQGLARPSVITMN